CQNTHRSSHKLVLKLPKIFDV
ncbi:hypothetical protein D039_3626B, partial [Vibrio parahaemolyticus EKP-028]